jgi:hypothetical protein
LLGRAALGSFQRQVRSRQMSAGRQGCKEARREGKPRHPGRRGNCGLVLTKILEARGRIELPIKVLQTFALPLGYRALDTKVRDSRSTTIIITSNPLEHRRGSPSANGTYRQPSDLSHEPAKPAAIRPTRMIRKETANRRARCLTGKPWAASEDIRTAPVIPTAPQTSNPRSKTVYRRSREYSNPSRAGRCSSPNTQLRSLRRNVQKHRGDERHREGSKNRAPMNLSDLSEPHTYPVRLCRCELSREAVFRRCSSRFARSARFR